MKVLRSGTLASLAAVVLTVGWLHLYGVPVADSLRFGTYLALCVSAPGMLLWRWLSGTSRGLGVDLAAGTATGYAFTLLTYMPFRAVGMPRLAVVPSLAILLIFAVVPRLRRHWRSRRGERGGEAAPVVLPWLLAAIYTGLLVWSGISFFRFHGLSGAGASGPYVDMPFQLALAAELKNHFPGQIPFVTGQPLHYHYFFHLHLAAASWGSGVELQVLLLRLAVLPMLAAYVVLVAQIAREVTGRWWAGPAAVVTTFLAAFPFDANRGWESLLTLWISPTQTFGGVIFAGLVLCLIRLLRSPDLPGWRPWVLFALLCVGVSAAKATYLPLLIAGLALLLLVQLLHRESRQRLRVTLIGGVIAVVAFAGAYLLVFAGSSTGLTIKVFGTLDQFRARPDHFLAQTLAWSAAWFVVLVIVFVADRSVRLLAASPAIVLFLGMGAAGLGAALVTMQPGQSQAYFVVSAQPYLAIAVIAGIAALPRRAWGRIVTAVVVATLVVLGVSQARGPIATQRATPGLLSVASAYTQIPAGGIAAARWIRAHSAVDDVIATNVHCLSPGAPVEPTCDARSFWVSAFAERRVLVEGWVYTPPWYAEAATSAHQYELPYWDQRLLAANQRVFAAPTSADLATLRDRYGVRWLLADRRLEPALARLGDVATRRFRAGDTVVFELR